MKIDICMCTFKRPQIKDTLESLANLHLNDSHTIRVVIADNDETSGAKTYILKCAKEYKLDVHYVHAPAKNISIARNACLKNATTDIIAFIDDDEIAKPNWLQELLQTHKETNAPAVLGPVKAIYGDTAPKWMREKDFHSFEPVFVNGEIITGYTSNLLLDRSAECVAPLTFREELGNSGGEDSAFLSELIKRGGKIAFAPNAFVTEAVPENRATLSWLAKRRFRMGQTHAMMTMEGNNLNTPAKVKSITITLFKFLYCCGFSALNILRKGHMYSWLLRGILHLGAIFKFCGKKDLKQYG